MMISDKNLYLTQEYLKECLDYDSKTDIFIWRKRPLKHFKATEKRTQFTIYYEWNKKYSNKKAGYLYKENIYCVSINNKHYFADTLVSLYKGNIKYLKPNNVLKKNKFRRRVNV